MKRWEFDSTEHASSCVFLWFSGTYHERLILQEYLDLVSGKGNFALYSFASYVIFSLSWLFPSTGDVFYDAQEDVSLATPVGVTENGTDDAFRNDRSNDGSGNSMQYPRGEHTALVSGLRKKRKIMKSCETNEVLEEACSEIVSSPTFSVSSSSDDLDCEITRSVSAATTYKDVLILFRFNDPYLPFKLKEIIMVDLRLLTLLEYGLPSWAIFLQSYPVFCQIYRPWMCPLARALYVLMSVITVLIGFYDLYKNVPLLKATASRLFGPFFDWIETWEMISRIKYLGTMLFLQNFEKAVRWLLRITHATKSLFSFLMAPIAEPIMEIVEFVLPLWNICLETAAEICSLLWFVLDYSYSMVMSTLTIVIWPLWFGASIVWSIGMVRQSLIFIFPANIVPTLLDIT